MLDKHLIYKTSPLAKKENIIIFKDYRITVLSPRLFRVEKSKKGYFVDEATQKIFYRDMKKVDYKKIITEDSLEIETNECKLILKASFEDSYILLNNKKVSLDNSKNLKGTYRTLDEYDGDVHVKRKEKLTLEAGVCSKNGVALLDDSNSLILNKEGLLQPRKYIEKDIYIFAYGNNYKAAIKALYLITGNVPLIPRFALGNWWSRYHDYTDKEYLRLMNKFIEREVPLTVATIDMDWHYSTNLIEQKKIKELKRENEDYYGKINGWTGYSWNKDLFKNYKKFLQELKNKNLHVTLNLHPADGVRWFEDCYEKFAEAMNRDPKKLRVIPFDITSDLFINNYFKILHKPYEKDGVDFWWIDWQQGTQSKMVGLDPLWSLNHYHYLDNQKNHQVPLILSRYSGIGSHRYPLGFSGDTIVSWNTLEYLPYFTLTASNAGYCWWSHDIGGHMDGSGSHELFTRHVQFGVFSPINRLHGSNSPTMTKEPWVYKNGTSLIIENALRFRHKMIPLLYNASYKLNKEGTPLIEPMYYYYDTPLAYKQKNQYVFAENLIVSPITTKVNKNGYAFVDVYLPKGRWVDIFTDEIYDIEEDKLIKVSRDLESIPVFAKEGSIIPLSNDKGNSYVNPKELEILIYPGLDNDYVLYEDDEEGNKAFTTFTLKHGKDNNLTLEISTTGTHKVVPNNREITLRFKTLKEGKITALENSYPIKDSEILSSCLTCKFNYRSRAKYLIKVKYDNVSKLDYLKEHLQSVLESSQEEHVLKRVEFEKIILASSQKEFIDYVNQSKLDKDTINRILEIA